MRSRQVQLWLRVFLGLGLLAVIVSRVDVSDLTVRPSPLVLGGVFLAIVLLVVAQAFSAIRWRVVLGPKAPSVSYLFRLYLVGQFFSVFLPTSVGGDAVRAAAAARSLDRPGDVVASVLIDRLLGVVALLIYLLIGLVLVRSLPVRLLEGANWNASVVIMAGTAGLLTVGATLVVRSRVRVWLREGLELLGRFRASRRRVLTAGILSLVVQGLYVGTWAVLARTTGLSLPLPVLLFTVPLVSLAAMLPITFSGLGVREGLWLVLLAPLAVSEADIVAYSLLYFVAFALAGLVGGLLFIVQGTELRAARASGGSG